MSPAEQQQLLQAGQLALTHMQPQPPAAVWLTSWGTAGGKSALHQAFLLVQPLCTLESQECGDALSKHSLHVLQGQQLMHKAWQPQAVPNVCSPAVWGPNPGACCCLVGQGCCCHTGVQWSQSPAARAA